MAKSIEEDFGKSPVGIDSRPISQAIYSGPVPEAEPVDFAIVANFGGSCSPNPGGIPKYAWVLNGIDGKELATGKGRADEIYPKTNNTAEFCGMLAAVNAAIGHADGAPILVQGDSQLAIFGIQKKWKIKIPHLVELANECRFAITQQTARIKFRWIPSAKNRRAAELTSRFNPSDG